MKKSFGFEITHQKKKKFTEAKKNYQRISVKIRPFIRKRKLKKYSTRGEWKTSGF